MMQYKGVIDFDHFGKRVTIPYSMDNLGGNAHIYVRDKKGCYHTFYYSSEWYLSGNYTLNWPPEFTIALFNAFDMERERWGLK